ncbi:MAG: glycosyltransferase family 9 protein, partial [bacterium]
MMENTPPKRILIVRLSAIGDVLMTSPVPRALKCAYPGVHIAWVVDKLSAPMVQGNPYVDDIIILDRKQWEKQMGQGKIVDVLRGLSALKRRLRAGNYDMAIDMQELFISGLVCWLSGARRRIGPIPAREMNQIFMTERVERPQVTTRLTDSCMGMLRGMGIDAPAESPVLVVPEADRQAAAQLLADAGLLDGRYVTCCISSSRPQKDWVASRWGELADELWQRHGLRTVLVGGPERKEQAEKLVATHSPQLISAVGRTTLLQASAICQGGVALVGVDTGLTYAGMANGVPTVALYGSTVSTWLNEEP